jgi:NAD(P)-dependent dehydrogenase (short-subunit alcohol dehydrogenase family)
MKLEGSVALVVGAESAVGAAIVRGLLARGAARVYVASNDSGSDRTQAGVVQLAEDPAQATDVGELARDLADVTLLVNCMLAVSHGVPLPAGSGMQPRERRSLSIGRTLDLIDAFAPVLAANGGGAVVNVLSVLCPDQPLADDVARVSPLALDSMLADDLQGRLAAQGTQLLYLRAQLAVGHGDQALDDQRALAGYFAMRVLRRLEPGDHHRWPQRHEAARRNLPVLMTQAGLERNRWTP